MFIWFHEKIVLKPLEQKKGKTRCVVLNGGRLIFTYAEAKLRGLKQKHFARGLRELIKAGLIDVHRRGSDLRNNYSIYTFSERWKAHGTDRFVESEMTPAGPQGYRVKRKIMGTCTDCTYRHAIEGNGSVRCGHPGIEEIMGTCPSQEPGFAKANVLAMVRKRLKVQIDSQAMKRQWFNFPWRFHAGDVRQCGGFNE
jgi:hypothetical protein